MIDEKNLTPTAAGRIGEFVRMSGGIDLVEKLETSDLQHSKTALDGLKDMRTFLQYCEYFGCQNVVSFDLSLARGLDYYTGVIYEALLTSEFEIWQLVFLSPIKRTKS